MPRPIELPISSGFVNGAIFVIVDLIALWAVHRGLLALQGLHLYHRISNGKKVRLQRSKIPIIAGELLVQQARWPHILVIANTFFICLAFIGTMGINGESTDKYVPVSLAYISRIRAHPTLDYGRDRLRPRIFLRCRTSDQTSLSYWPGAFNVSGNAHLADPYNFLDRAGVQHHVNLSTLSCQSKDSRLDPMLIVRNCHPAESGCSAAVDPRKATVRLLPQNATLPGFPKEWRDERVGRAADIGLITIYRTIQSSTAHKIAAPGDRLVCLEFSPRGSDLRRGQGRLNCFLFKWNADSTEARIAFGSMFIAGKDWERIDQIEMRLEITTATATLRWNYAQLGEKFFADGLRDLGVSSYSLTDVMDNAVSRAVAAEVPSLKVYKKADASITVIETYAFVCLIVVAVCAVSLCCMKEIISFLMRKEAVGIDMALGANRYDTLSAMLRAEQERLCSSLESGESAELGIIIAQNGLRRIGPLSEMLQPVDDGGWGDQSCRT